MDVTKQHYILVKNLPTHILEDNLRSTFGPSGEIINMIMLRPRTNRQTGVQSRAAYIEYSEPSACADAIQRFNNTQIDEFTIEVVEKQPQPSNRPIFTANAFALVKNLPATVVDASVRGFFTGREVQEVVILPPRVVPPNTEPTCAAYVQFTSIEQCNEAIAEFNGKPFDDTRTLSLENARSPPRARTAFRSPRPARAPRAPRKPTAAVPQPQPQALRTPAEVISPENFIIVKKLSLDTPNEDIEKLFSQFGEIKRTIKVPLRKARVAGQQLPPAKNFFIEYDNVQCCQAALAYPVLYGEKPLDVEKARQVPIKKRSKKSTAASPTGPAPRATTTTTTTALKPTIVGRQNVLQAFRSTKNPVHTILRNLAAGPRDFRGTAAKALNVAVEMFSEGLDSKSDVFDLCRFVVLEKTWNWDCGVHISALANTISLLATRSIYTHAYLFLVGDTQENKIQGIIDSEAKETAVTIQQQLSSQLYPPEICKIRVHKLPQSEEPRSVISVELMPQSLVVSFGGVVLLWDPLYMRSIQLLTMGECSLLQAELSSRNSLGAASYPLGCTVCPTADASLVGNDVHAIDGSLLLRFFENLNELRGTTFFPDPPEQVTCAGNSRRCGPRLERELVQALQGQAPQPRTPKQHPAVHAASFAFMRWLHVETSEQDIREAFGNRPTIKDIIITSPTTSPQEPQVMIRNAFVQFGTPEECREALAVPSLQIHGQSISVEIARRVPRSKMVSSPAPAAPTKPRLSHEAIVETLETFGLWPHEAARILFARSGARPGKQNVQIITHSATDHVRNVNGGLAELLTLKMVEDLRSMMVKLQNAMPQTEQRRERPPPASVIFEALMNAVAHADYRARFPRIAIHVFPDRIDVCNDIAGSPAQLFAHGSVMRPLPHHPNPILARFFIRCGLMKGMSFGRQQMYLDALGAGCPLPKTEIKTTQVKGSRGDLQQQWVTTLYSSFHADPAAETASSCFNAISEILHDMHSETMLVDAVVLITGFLVSDVMCQARDKAVDPASAQKPAPRPLSQICEFVGDFMQPDLARLPMPFYDKSPIVLTEREQGKYEIELADWAWAQICQSDNFAPIPKAQ
eukprot:gnl/Trimastix_PCT/1566.p1 GENE.gnl/Trimastix_PCT/1566~~gnl/Trimastix_PCT/1566.p1  ORF type:complete len:1116 (+),score=332.33 gnl/Trimastix_PCT/1566:86-3349(+)